MGRPNATIRLEDYIPTQPDEYPIGYTVMANFYRIAEGWAWEIMSYEHPNPGMAPGDPNGELYDDGYPEPSLAAAVRSMAASWADRWGTMDDPMGDGPEARM